MIISDTTAAITMKTGDNRKQQVATKEEEHSKVVKEDPMK